MASSLGQCKWKYLECDLFILGILKCVFQIHRVKSLTLYFHMKMIFIQNVGYNVCKETPLLPFPLLLHTHFYLWLLEALNIALE